MPVYLPNCQKTRKAVNRCSNLLHQFTFIIATNCILILEMEKPSKQVIEVELRKTSNGKWLFLKRKIIGSKGLQTNSCLLTKYRMSISTPKCCTMDPCYRPRPRQWQVQSYKIVRLLLFAFCTIPIPVHLPFCHCFLTLPCATEMKQTHYLRNITDVHCAHVYTCI